MHIESFWRLIKQTSQAWLAYKTSRLGAALAFYSVLSLSPLLVILLAMSSYLWGTQAAQGEIAKQMNDLVDSQSAKLIESILATAAENKNSGFIAVIIGMASLFLSASAVFNELHDAMNMIWHTVPPAGKSVRVFIREKLFSVFMVISCGFILLLSVVISTVLSAATHYLGGWTPVSFALMKIINFIVSFGIVVLLFALIFKTVPDVDIAWRKVWLGAFLTAILFIIGKGLIALYLGHAGIGSSYGAAGSLVILLVWIYYSAQILFFGAHFTYLSSEYLKGHNEPTV